MLASKTLALRYCYKRGRSESVCLSAKERVSFCKGRWQAFIAIERLDSGLMEKMARLLQSPQAFSVINARLKKEDKWEKNEVATQKAAT